jgi:hypothetical protein
MLLNHFYGYLAIIFPYIIIKEIPIPKSNKRPEDATIGT